MISRLKPYAGDVPEPTSDLILEHAQTHMQVIVLNH